MSLVQDRVRLVLDRVRLQQPGEDHPMTDLACLYLMQRTGLALSALVAPLQRELPELIEESKTWHLSLRQHCHCRLPEMAQMELTPLIVPMDLAVEHRQRVHQPLVVR